MSNIDQSLDKYIPVSGVIRSAKEAGYDFGKGNCINRLRYYIKLGMLPHMQRRQADPHLAYTEGYLPIYSIVLLLKIQDLKRQGRPMDEIKVLIKDELAHYKRQELMVKFDSYPKPITPAYSTVLMFVVVIVMFSLYTLSANNTGQALPTLQSLANGDLSDQTLYTKKQTNMFVGNNLTGTAMVTSPSLVNSGFPEISGLFIDLENKSKIDINLAPNKGIYKCVNW